MSRYYDDDDGLDIQIQKGSIEDAEELLARLDKIFVKSSYDIFARDDLMLLSNDIEMIGFDGGIVVFRIPNKSLSKNKGECYIMYRRL